jgi:fucose permease
MLTGFLGFLLLGMPYAALGVAWPSMAADLERPLGDLGIVLVATTAGYVSATLANGYVTHRFGTGRVLPIASALATAAIAVWAAAGSLLVLVAAAIALGTAGGAVDAGVNAYVAVQGGTRSMGWLHATFGLGSALGPLIATVLLGGGASWRVTFWVLAVAQLGVTFTFAATRRTWPHGDHRVEEPPRLPRRLWPVLGVGLVAFGLYTGVEVAAGEWSYSLFTEGRGIGIRSAGYLVTGYWAAVTVGRVAMGLAGDRVTRRTLLLASLTGTMMGAVLLWWSPAAWVGAVGLLVMGLYLAPVFPVLVLITADVMGPAYAPRAVGYQIAAAGVGAAAIPGLIGALVGAEGIEVTGPLIAGASVALLGAGAAVIRLAIRRAGPAGSG